MQVLNGCFLQEAASVISQRAVNPREVFRQKERGMTPGERESSSSPQPGEEQPKCSIGMFGA